MNTEKAIEISNKDNKPLIQSFNDNDIIDGQAALCSEIYNSNINLCYNMSRSGRINIWSIKIF